MRYTTTQRQLLRRREPPFGFATSTGRKPTPPSGLTATHWLPYYFILIRIAPLLDSQQRSL
ncbi:MAG: hypothetical protein ICV85_06650 [Tolypothrix sp. T3-bin4]|nr:hypothetical protein [Tolypothrix sp. T3-bin4]